MNEQHQSASIVGLFVVLLVSLVLWGILFFTVKRIINKKIIFQKKIISTSQNYQEKLFDLLQFHYHIREIGSAFEISSEKFNDLITHGRILIEVLSIGEEKKITIVYYRQLKFLGFLIVLISIMLCYVGVLIPYLMMNETKKRTLKEIDNIFFEMKAIRE